MAKQLPLRAASVDMSDTPKPRARATSRRKQVAAPADGADAPKPHARGTSRRKKAAAQEDKSGEAPAGSGTDAAQEHTEEVQPRAAPETICWVLCICVRYNPGCWLAGAGAAGWQGRGHLQHAAQ